MPSTIILVTEETELNLVGARYIGKNYYADVTDNYIMVNQIDGMNDNNFGIDGIEMNDEEAITMLLQ